MKSPLLLVIFFVAGCGTETAKLRVWGEASYDEKPIESGQIIFVPIDNTPGPSTGGTIEEGKFDLQRQDGLRAGGTYRVEITAYAGEKTYTPNASGRGTTATVRKQFIPDKYNRNSGLRLEISATEAENECRFELTK